MGISQKTIFNRKEDLKELRFFPSLSPHNFKL